MSEKTRSTDDILHDIIVDIGDKQVGGHGGERLSLTINCDDIVFETIGDNVPVGSLGCQEVKIHSQDLLASQRCCRQSKDAGAGPKVDHGGEGFAHADNFYSLQAIPGSRVKAVAEYDTGVKSEHMRRLPLRGDKPGGTDEKAAELLWFQLAALPLLVRHFEGVEQ